MTTRPKLADLKKICPQDLVHCEGYIWDLQSRIGKGSFSEVFLGWNTTGPSTNNYLEGWELKRIVTGATVEQINSLARQTLSDCFQYPACQDGTQEVAVKVVRKEFFKQDPKVRENLEREVRLLRLLQGCEYVVHLYHAQELKHFVVLVMELCEYDLDHLVKVQPLLEDDITIFLHQFCLGMKALRDQNIVHRDLKPSNVLITKHPHTGKMMIKLAGFGFARHFRDECQKPIDMTSLAGTPVFMAPEALRSLFHPGEHYDDKVDIWSIGALLYKVIVGQCGFHAPLQDIPRILKRKGDAIAFERADNKKVNYIYELPSSVNTRLSKPFQEKMNTLLRVLLKLDPTERMTFLELLEFVDDLITSKVEVINLLHGTSFKIIFDPHLTAEQLTAEIFGHFGIPADGQVVFSSSSVRYLSSHTHLTPQQFSELLDGAGGKQSHAILYLLPIPQVQSEKLQPDFSCLSKLIYAVDDPQNCVSLILDYKFTDEIVHAINHMQVQQKRQLAGMEEFCNFCSRECFTTQYPYIDLHQRGLQVLAKGGMAEEWLRVDIANLADTSLPAAVQVQIQAQLTEIKKQRTEIDNLVQELTQWYHSCSDTLRNKKSDSDLKKEELSKVTAVFTDEAKRLLKTRRDQIHAQCKQLLDDCKQQVLEVTERVRTVLKGAMTSLVGIWEMMVVAGELEEKCVSFEQYLTIQVLQFRGNMFKSLTTDTPPTHAHRQASPGRMTTGGTAGTLTRFELDGVRDTGREVGHGSYAVVKELEYRGLKCVGKKIHGILFESAMPHEKAAMLERFAEECELLAGLHHPCIVQFLGVWYEQGSRVPVLVMEYLHTTLSACLERYGILPEEISYGILRDVALGLRYLHERSPPIIHRDLSANNVLLTSNMNAKLSDLGVAKILNLTPARMTQMTQTKAPGTPCYMPPEALIAKPKYTSKIDVYSYGVLIIHTLCGKWPFPEDVFRPDPQNPGTVIPISEVERREEYLQEIGNDHPLMALIHQCLSNVPAYRPEAPVLLDRVNTIFSTLPQQFTNRVEMLQSKRSEIDSLTQSEIKSLRAEVERLSVRNTPQQDSSWSPAPSPTSSPLIKIAKPSEYGPGDLVMFHPIKLQRSKSSAPMLLHLQRPKPWILMDIGSYAAFGIRPGRMPDTILAKLTEKPRRFLFEEDEDMAKELGEKHGEFFRVRAEPGPLKFTTSTGKPFSRPPPPGRHQEPRSPGPLQQMFGKVRDMV